MEKQNKKNWVQRNWLWAAPVGCVGAIALFIGFFAIIFIFVFSMMKSSDAYKSGFSIAQSDPLVQEAIGIPIKAGMFVSGNISISGGSGHAELSIPISGPKGSGTIYLEAKKSADQWHFDILEVEIKGSKERIYLMEQTIINNVEQK